MVCPVAAIDAVPGRVPGTKGEYALVVLDCEGKLLLQKIVNFTKLLRLLWEIRPKLLAVDNIMELGRDKRELLKVLNLLPPETEVVQVTRVNGIFVDLKDLARKFDLKVYGKPDPLETAYLLAVLASKGVGTKLKAYEEKTKIVVTKGRTPRAGGSSLNRFKRATKNAVMETVREIKKILDEEGFDYDLVTKKSDGSIESAIFTVYTSRKNLEGKIKPISTSAVKVKIRPVITRHITFEDETEEESKYLIVGFDPGINTGLAILDLDGNVLLTATLQNADRGDIVSLIRKFGVPIVIAVDTNPPPHSAKKLAGVLKAQLYVPRSSLPVSEKERIEAMMKEKGVQIKDSHQRDAIAAAYKAWTEIHEKLKKVDAYLDKIGIEVNRDKIKIEVLGGKTLAEAVEEEIAKVIDEEKVERSEQPRYVKTQSFGRDLRLAQLEAENVWLKLKLKELTEELKKKEWEMNLLKNSVESNVEAKVHALKEALRSLSLEVEKLRKELETKEEMLKEAEEEIVNVSTGERVPGMYIERITFTTEYPEEMLEKSLKVLYSREVEDLNDDFIDALKSNNNILIVEKITKKAEERLNEAGLPVLRREDVKKFIRLVTVGKDVFEEWERLREEIIESGVDAEDIERMLLEYRMARWK